MEVYVRGSYTSPLLFKIPYESYLNHNSTHQIFCSTISWDFINKWLISPGEAYMKGSCLIMSSIMPVEELMDVILKE